MDSVFKLFESNRPMEMDELPEMPELGMEPEIKKRKRKFSTTELDELPLTISYIPMQKIEGTYKDAEALERGTLFPNLDKPFKGKMLV